MANKSAVMTRSSLREACQLIQDVYKMDGNEAETRKRLERIFENLLGYDGMKHLSREHAVRASGLTEHLDFAIRLDGAPDATPLMVVETKAVGVDLRQKHIKQATSYAINLGCNWILLTNGREWHVYHMEFRLNEPPDARLLEQWNLLNDDPADLLTKFATISYRSVKRGELGKLWETAKVLQPNSLLAAMLSRDSLKTMRRVLKKEAGVQIALEDIVEGIRKLFNDAAMNSMEEVELTWVSKKPRRPRKQSTDTVLPEEAQQPLDQQAGDKPADNPATP